MFLLTQASILKCTHGGIVLNRNSQDWVRLAGIPLLVEDDPLHRPISNCPMGAVTTPCTTTVTVDDASYSTLIRIDGHRVCLDSTGGRTNGSQTGLTPFSVTSVRQDLVRSGA